MKIGSRLTLQFTLIVTLIVVFFSLAVYFFSSDYREKEFYAQLRERAATTAKLFSQDVKEVDLKLMKVIDKNLFNLSKSKKITSVYDYKTYALLYKNTDKDSSVIPDHFLKKVKQEQEAQYETGNNEMIGIVFKGVKDEYIVTSSGYDYTGHRKLQFLKYSLLIAVFVTIGITIILGLFFSKQALQPIARVVDQADKITISNLHSRVDEGNGTDEIAQLAINFNKMLERLETAFEMQRSFVSNASHELRTPLTLLTGQLEVSLMNKQINQETQQLLKLLLEDIKNLNLLSNGLLNLAQASLDISEIKVAPLRIDELIGQARAELLKRNAAYKVFVEFGELPEDEEKLIVNGSEHLLKIALLNLLDNACKYSQLKEARAFVSFEKNDLKITVKDQGIGIPEGDLYKIIEPFFRSENARAFAGHGIGLSLTQRIIKSHKGELHISSVLNKGTSVQVIFHYS